MGWERCSCVFGGLIIYTLANTLVPGFALRLPAAEFETPRAPEVEAAPVYAVEKDDVARQARQ